ncbi:sensor histidine kinase [Flavobacterium jejuense]|uniref:histidine kinase n=1 Tax=Flavobacterium jejuense TaxID=1544455 RepID=A0ABX0ITP8_9FLAO|nr:sensor histidine kinase [Flavobacterium jejuense]NHN27083.1 sensor histidine kinase [Flavobacterium jejuense]
MSKKGNNYLKFNFDVSAYRLLGRELITDRITALFELVKNAYDSNSNSVTVEFIDINPVSNKSKIIISDDGLGMDYSDIKNKWMVIGTSNKRRSKTSPPPYNRAVSGKKGVGRFAVDKLGAKLVLKTKKKNFNQMHCLETDWVSYSKIENNQLKLDIEDQKDFFTDIENKYWLEDSNGKIQGTILEISEIENVWTETDISRAYKELSKLISPNNNDIKFPFRITIISQYDKYLNRIVVPQLIDFATLKIELNFNKENNTQQIVQCIENNLKIIDTKIGKAGPVKFTLYYFNKSAKEKYKKHFETEIEGIKIYRDGVITTPFAEYIEHQDEQKDILGIDKRRYSGFFDKVSTRDLLGFVEITEIDNPNIIESTNRQGFVDNESWDQLKKFIIEQLIQLEKFLKVGKVTSRKKTQSGLKGVKETISDLKEDIASVKGTTSQEVSVVLTNIEKNLGKLQGAVNKSLNDYIKLEEESKQTENLFFSLVSLQSYAAMFSHMTQHSIGHVIRDAEYFSKNYKTSNSYNERFSIISERIYKEFLNLRHGVEFMLKYAKSDTDLEDINIKEILNHLFLDIYNDRFRKENIKTIIEIDKDLIINYNRKAIEDIFDNLISNSIKALKNTKDKIIKCSSNVSNEELTIFFSDNGIGIEEEDKYRIFDIFFTKTAEDGGAGMGLYTVKTRIESMRGTIEVIENELKPSGATFKINLPFNK